MKDGNVFETMQEFYQAMADGETIEKHASNGTGWHKAALDLATIRLLLEWVASERLRIKPKIMTDAEKLQYIINEVIILCADESVIFPDGTRAYATKEPKTVTVMVNQSANTSSGYRAKIRDNYNADYIWTGWQEHEITWREE